MSAESLAAGLEDRRSEPEVTDVVQELDAKGQGAGVESEDIYGELEDTILDPFDPRLIDVTTETRTLDTLIKRLAIHQIDLDPEFQRLRDIWPSHKKGQLIESLLLRIPLPTFYVAEIDVPGELGSDQWAVVDGIQRLSTIAEFVAPEIVGLKPLRLKGLQYLGKTLEGKTFAELSQAMQLRILESQFTIQVIRKSTPELVRDNIFARINTGGLPLTPQELRHALTPGPARGLLREMADLEVFKAAVDHSVSPSRMADREMVLRYLAFRMEDPLSYRAKDFDAFLRSCMQRINTWGPVYSSEVIAEFGFVMRACREIFGREAFRKRYRPEDQRRPVSKALFEGVSVAVAKVAFDREASIAALVARARDVQAKFIELMHDVEFDRAISQGTGDPAKVRYRFRKLSDLMTSMATDD